MPGPVPIDNQIPVSVTSVELAPDRPWRRSIIIYNHSTQSLYIRYKSPAQISPPLFAIRNPPNWYGTIPWGGILTHEMYGVWAGADPTGYAMVTELVN